MSVEVAWAAGFFDGEGCVLYYYSLTAANKKGRITTALNVSNCDARGLLKMQKLFGGTIRRTEKRALEGRSEIGVWTVTGEDAENTAKILLPYCVLKREQLELFLEARQKTIFSKGTHITEKIQKLRIEYATAIKSLKRPQWEGV